MSDFSSRIFDQEQNSEIIGDDNFENDDLITFQHCSKKINIYYSQLTKYSKHIRETYLFSDVTNRFPQEIRQFQEDFQLLPENIDLFFELLQQNYNINEDLVLTYAQCIDILKICKFLKVRKLSFKINQYIRSHNVDVDFIIQMLEYNVKTQAKTDNPQIEISNEIEDLLSNKINECLLNDKFIELPIQIIHRVIRKNSHDSINSNKLFDIIIKSVSKFCVLFPFLDLQKLSDDRLEELCEMYSKSNENTQHFFDYLKCNLNLINEIRSHKKNLQEMNDQQQKKLSDFEIEIKSLQSQLNDSKEMNDQQQNKVSDLEIEIKSLKSQLSDSKNLNSEQQDKMKDLETLLQKQFNDSEKMNGQLQDQINYSKNLENQIGLLQKQLNKLFLIKGQVIAEINLKSKSSALDTGKSKVIVSTSDAKSLGSEAYEKGEPITSLHMKTSFYRKPDTYYVRCIVFNSEGESNEIVSNSVTTSGSSLTFDYKGEPIKIQLSQGRYVLEVWGAKGGDSTGECCSSSDRSRFNSTIQGGLGGYSRGVLNLNKKETVYVFVGGEGCPSNSSDGSSTKGGFPDGGGTKTGHSSACTTVPGTGGGSTSIRIGSDTNYSRVIVAGGGGGAGGDSCRINPGGFGGGLNGGNCFYLNSLQSQGAGTQTGSTRGLGEDDDRHGDPGVFGSGATGKYRHGCDSGGGGGGGWFGGGSGGYGCANRCSGGGGGSGWTFAESSFKTFQSGDSANASKFALSSSYYLTDVKCVGGNEEFPRPNGNGNEKGHIGNGYAKITPL